MIKMGLHTEQLNWAGSWFRRLSYAAIVITILAAVGQVLNIIHPTPLNSTFNVPTMQFISAVNFVTTIIGGLLTAFLMRVGFIICSFLSDFASGLAAQQIRRERQNQQ